MIHWPDLKFPPINLWSAPRLNEEYMRESEIEKYLVKRCKEEGILCRKIEYVGRRGAPDRMLVLGGIIVFVELKQESGKVSRLQKIEHNKLKEYGVNVAIVWSVYDVNHVLFSYFGIEL